ncbi:MAG: hypothetical protein KA004_01475 [Verrucomicrobiales bacterium]|nr:hypothetical protein [Verrucomicrobiales bacterium]
MNLREKLKVLLPEILPANPAESIKGTEIIRLVKLRLKQEYSDATLRYHFSIMCCDPASPIAKVEQGQGYYLRTASPVHSGNRGQVTPYQARLGLMFENQPEVLDLAVARQQKLRAIYFRLLEQQGRQPFLFESSFGEEAPYENVWKCPDLAVVDWELGEHLGDDMQFDPATVAFKRSLGQPLCTLSSVKLKLEVTYNSFREDFYQALSNSTWAQHGELVIAAPLVDEQLVEDLRRLGARHGIAISSLGISRENLDDLPPHWAIQQLSAREFDALEDRLEIHRFTTHGDPRPLNWRQVERVRQDNADFDSLFSWLQRSLADGRAHSYQQFTKLLGEEIIREGRTAKNG